MRWLPCGKGITCYTMMGPQTKPTWMPSKRYIRCHGGLQGSQPSYGGYSHGGPVVQKHGWIHESMEPAPDAWSRYWDHHPRPFQEVLWNQRCRCIIQQHHPHSTWSSIIQHLHSQGNCSSRIQQHHCQGMFTKSRSQRQLCQSSKCKARWCPWLLSSEKTC